MKIKTNTDNSCAFPSTEAALLDATARAESAHALSKSYHITTPAELGLTDATLTIAAINRVLLIGARLSLRIYRAQMTNFDGPTEFNSDGIVKPSGNLIVHRVSQRHFFYIYSSDVAMWVRDINVDLGYDTGWTVAAQHKTLRVISAEIPGTSSKLSNILQAHKLYFTQAGVGAYTDKPVGASAGVLYTSYTERAYGELNQYYADVTFKTWVREIINGVVGAWTLIQKPQV